AVDRQPRAAIGGSGNAEGLDRDQYRCLGRTIGDRGSRGRFAVALDLEAARRADQQVMQQRIDGLLAALLALFEVKGGVEARMRVAPLARALFKIMDERVDIALRDVGISLDVIFGVEEAGFSYGFIIAEQRFHPGPCIASARNATGTGRSWSNREQALRVSHR